MDYHNNILLFAYYFDFDIMNDQVLSLAKMCIIYTSFISLDSTPIAANTVQNNPKTFKKINFQVIIN